MVSEDNDKSLGHIKKRYHNWGERASWLIMEQIMGFRVELLWDDCDDWVAFTNCVSGWPFISFLPDIDADHTILLNEGPRTA